MTRRRSPTERLHPLAHQVDRWPVDRLVAQLLREDARAAAAVLKNRRWVAQLARRATRTLAAGGRILYVGAGTSGRLGALDAAECPPTFGSSPRQVQGVMAGGPRALRRAVEGAEDDGHAARRQLAALRLKPADLVCGISASARTPFVLAALAEARRWGAQTALVSCHPGAKVRVDLHVAVDTGPELIAGSTRLKAAVATQVVLHAVSTAAMTQVGRVFRGHMVDVKPTNAKLKARAEAMIAQLAPVTRREARRLLKTAKTPRVALAMAWSGEPRVRAKALLRTHGLSGLRRP